VEGHVLSCPKDPGRGIGRWLTRPLRFFPVLGEWLHRRTAALVEPVSLAALAVPWIARDLAVLRLALVAQNAPPWRCGGPLKGGKSAPGPMAHKGHLSLEHSPRRFLSPGTGQLRPSRGRACPRPSLTTMRGRKH
jgi:hypothetical protein